MQGMDKTKQNVKKKKKDPKCGTPIKYIMPQELGNKHTKEEKRLKEVSWMTRASLTGFC